MVLEEIKKKERKIESLIYDRDMQRALNSEHNFRHNSILKKHMRPAVPIHYKNEPNVPLSEYRNSRKSKKSSGISKKRKNKRKSKRNM